MARADRSPDHAAGQPLIPTVQGMHNAVSAQDRLPVVVAVNGSRTGLATLDFAAAEAVRHRARLTIVHVWPGHYAGPFRGRGAIPDHDDGRRLLQIAASRAALAAPGLPVETEMLDGAAGNILAGGAMLDDDRIANGAPTTAASAVPHSAICTVTIMSAR